VNKFFPDSLICLSLLVLAACSPLVGGETNTGESRTAAVDVFMNARLLEHNVAARNLMTANLENAYLRNKKLSVRVKSGRIVSYDFDPERMITSGEKEFGAEVTSVWADLNEQVFETQRERIKFLALRGEWFADEIDLLKKEPIPGLPPMDLENAKQIKFAVAVAKKFAKAIINRNYPLILQLTSQEYQARFKNQDEMMGFLCSGENPRYSAVDVRNYRVKDPREISFQLGFYRVAKGKRGCEVAEVEVVTKEGSLDWNVVEFLPGPIKKLSSIFEPQSFPPAPASAQVR